MQPLISIEKKTLTKTKSARMYPKKETTFIVAFAVNESTKTPSTELVNESHPSKSLNMTPSASSKTLTINSSNQDMADTLPVNGAITVIKENCGDGNERPEILNNISDCSKINKVTSQPEIMYVAQKHVRKRTFDTKSKDKKFKKCKPVFIHKNIYFKNQLARNMTTKLKRYCKTSRKTFDGFSDIHKEQDSESISEKISRTRILKKVRAKENLALANKNIHSQFEKKVPSNGNSSFISISSQDTLKEEESPLSANSIIEITDSRNKSFNTNVLNIAVAQINNTPIMNKKSYSVIVPQKTDFKDSLTSCESAYSQTLMLTSKSFLDDTVNLTSKNTISDAVCSNSNVSNETLMPPETKAVLSRDIYENSHSDETNNNSYSLCTSKFSFTNQLNSCHNISNGKQKDLRTQAFYDACMTFNVYSKTKPCSSSVPDFPNNDNVIIAEGDILKNTQKIQKTNNRGDEQFGSFKNDLRANIFQKPFGIVNTEDYQKSLNLPNAAQIKDTIVETSRPQRKCSQEVNDYPASFPELCDKLTIILEIAVKKLEQTLSEKIVSELKRSLYEIDKQIHSITKLQHDSRSECMSKDIKLESPRKSKDTLQPTPQNDAYLQCDIVRNEVIDNLMLTFNEGYSKSCLESSSSNYTHKLKKPKLVKDYFDILKNPLSSHYNELDMGKGDSIQISIEDSVEQKIPKFELKKMFWTTPIAIVRENMFVIASVPAFLFFMFVIYSYILLLIRMWWY